MDKRAEQKNRTRRALTEVALKLSAEKGFASLSLREVASAAGITPAGFYRHFRDMEDLGLALLDEVSLSLRRLLRDARYRISPGSSAIEESVVVFLDYVNQNANLFRLLLGERQGATATFRKAIHAEMDQFIGELTEDLERESASLGKPLRNAALAAEVIVAVVFTVGAEALDMPKHKQASLATRLVEEIKMVLRGARERSSAGSRKISIKKTK